MDDTQFAEQLSADMARLEARPYAQVGVPMLLLAEDLRGPVPRLAGDAVDPDVLAALERMHKVIDTGPTDVTPGGIARLLEVIADRTLLGPDAAFTRLSDPA